MRPISLITLGLWITPFVFWKGHNLRTPKEYAFLFFSIALGLLAISRGKVRPIKNVWLFLCVLYGMVSIMSMPTFPVYLGNAPAHNFWVWKPILFQIAALLGVIGIASMPAVQKRIDVIVFSLIYPATIAAVYMILQYFGIDDFFGLNNHPDNPFIPSAEVGGFIGHPTLTGPACAMIAPLALYKKKLFPSILLIGGVLITKSIVAIAGLCFGILVFLYLYNYKTKTKLIRLAIIFSVVICSLSALYVLGGKNIKDIAMAESNGRFTEWARIAKDFVSPPFDKRTYVSRGFGPGSFYYAYSLRKQSRMRQAHNEYLEFLYTEGIIGFLLVSLAAWTMIKKINFRNNLQVALVSCLACISFCAAGTFVWQIGVTAFLTVVIIGLFHNERFLQGDFV